MSKKIISFPHMGNYYVPAKFVLEHILDVEVMVAPKITNKTVELGTKNSPDFVCMPFKYTLGTFIEALDKGANVLIQAGGGCRYGYYSELQEKILKDLGYDFTYINLVSQGQTDPKRIYQYMKEIDSNFSIRKALYYGFIGMKMMKYMDKIDDFIRQNVGFEVEKNSFIHLLEEMLNDFGKVKSYHELRSLYKLYKQKFRMIPIDKPKDSLKIGVIGELYTLMEPFSNYQLEMELAKMHMEVKRYTNVHYLLFEKGRKMKKYIKYAKEYIKYPMGADAADNIGRAKYLCSHGYDGVIHIKSSFCTPEIGAMGVINKVCHEYDVPVLFFSFDSSTTEVGIKTRLEAFNDMIEMRKKNEKLLFRD